MEPRPASRRLAGDDCWPPPNIRRLILPWVYAHGTMALLGLGGSERESPLAAAAAHPRRAAGVGNGRGRECVRARDTAVSLLALASCLATLQATCLPEA